MTWIQVEQNESYLDTFRRPVLQYYRRTLHELQQPDQQTKKDIKYQLKVIRYHCGTAFSRGNIDSTIIYTNKK